MTNKPQQQTLFRLPEPQEKYKKRGWFYITRRGGTEMLVAIDAHGDGIWLEHNLQAHIPHIISHLNTAQIVMRSVGGSEVRKCWYTRVAGTDVTARL